MTKRAIIEDFLRKGKTPKEIHKATGISLKYIRNISCDLKNQGTMKRADSKYKKSDKGKSRIYSVSSNRSVVIKKWRMNHSEKWRADKRRSKKKRQKETLPFATKYRQEWTLADINYVETHGSTDTIKEIALALGRTYHAVQNIGHQYGIDLRGNKMGMNANQFRSVKRRTNTVGLVWAITPLFSETL